MNQAVNIDSLEEHRNSNTLVLNRASTGIYLSLLAWSNSGKILMPANICYSPIRVSIEAGYVVNFFNCTNLTYDCRDVVRIANSDKNIKAILLPKLYGYEPKNIEYLNLLDANRKWLIIEDMAQTFGNKFILNNQSNVSVVTIYSFGESKFIDNFKAGLLICDSNQLYEKISEFYRCIPILSDELEIEIDKKDEANKLVARKSGDWYTYYTQLGKVDSRRFVLKKESQPVPKIYKNIIESKKLNVFNKAELFRQKLSNISGVEVPREGDYNKENPVWRFTVLLEEARRNKLISILRAKSLPVSSWYQVVPLYLGLVDKKNVYESSLFEKQVINFWVNEQVNTQYIQTVIDNI